MNTKQCTKCKRILPLDSSFTQYKKKSQWNNNVYACWRSRCRKCLAIDKKQWQLKNIDKISDYYHKIDKHRSFLRQRVYRERHPERAYQAVARYRKTRRGMFYHRIEALLYHHRKKNRVITGECSPDQLIARFDYFGNLCWMCGKTANSMDHVIPLSKNGTFWPANLRPACRSCNASKGNKILLPSEY